MAKAIRIKRKGGEEKKEKWERERGGQRLFHYDRHVFPSSTNYDLFEFVRVLRVSSIFPARARPIFVHAFSIHTLELRARAPVRTERRQIDSIDESNALR